VRVGVWYNLGGGGAKRALHDHIQGLQARGHEVQVWCPSSARTDFLPLSALCTENVDPIDETKLAVTTRRDFAANSLRPRRGIAELDGHFERCAQSMRRWGADVVFANTCQYNAVPALAGRVGVPSVLYLQEPRRLAYEAHPVLPWVGTDGDDTGRRSWRRRARELGLLRQVRALARSEVSSVKAFDKVLVNSVFSRESLSRAYGIDATVCYLGVDTDRFRPTGSGPDGYLVSVGQVVPHKRMHLVVAAVAALPTPRPRLVLIGDRADDGYLATLQAAADAAGVDLEVRLSVSDDELVDTLGRATALVHAARLEPFGYAPLEAGACSVPSVVVAEGGLKETVLDGQTGWVTEPNVPALAAALRECWDDRGEAERRGAEAHTWVHRRWQVDAAAGRLERELTSAVEGAV